jgi:hypothetical protein
MFFPETKKIWTVSIDIGKKNFAFYIQEIDMTEIIKINHIPYNRRYNQNGTLTKEMDTIMNKIYKTGKSVMYSNNDITMNCDKNAYLDPETYHNMIDILDQNIEFFDKCSYIIIEQQMSFRKAYNTMCLKLAQHCYSYFTFKYGRFKQVLYWPAFKKTLILGAPKIKGKKYKNGKQLWKSMTKYQRKKWSVEKAREILLVNDELDVWEKLSAMKKKDDITDCILMAYTFIFEILIK